MSTSVSSKRSEVTSGPFHVKQAVDGSLKRRRLGHGVKDLLHTGTDLRRGRPGARSPRGAREVKQVSALSLVQPQRASDRVEHLVRNAPGVPALELGVVVDADAGQHRHFFPPQPRDPPVAAVGNQARLLRSDLGAP
jgi:hypothetical protein